MCTASVRESTVLVYVVVVYVVVVYVVLVYVMNQRKTKTVVHIPVDVNYWTRAVVLPSGSPLSSSQGTQNRKFRQSCDLQWIGVFQRFLSVSNDPACRAFSVFTLGAETL